MVEQRRGVRWGTIAAILVAAALVATAVLVMTSRQPRVEQSREFADSFDGVRHVAVEVDDADVQVGASERAGATGTPSPTGTPGATGTADTAGTVSVNARIHWNTGPQPPYSTRLDGDTLTVRVGGCGFKTFGAFCEAHVALTVTPGVTLNVTTDSGDVEVAGVQGAVRLVTDSGDADLRQLGGTLKATMDSGSLAGTALASTSVEAELDSGNVNLQFVSAPVEVSTMSDSGSVVIELPTGSGPYEVQTRTDSGESSVEVSTGTGAGHRIAAQTDSGDISIGYQST